MTLEMILDSGPISMILVASLLAASPPPGVTSWSTGGSSPVTAIAEIGAAPESPWIAGSDDGLHVFELRAPSPVRRLETALHAVHDLELSPDGQRLAVAGGDPGASGTLEVLRWPGGQKIHTLKPHRDIIYSVHWHRSENRLVTAGHDGRIALIDLDRENRPRYLEGHSRAVTGAIILPRDSGIVSAGSDRSLRLWKDGRLLRSFSQHRDSILALALRPALSPSETGSDAEDPSPIWVATAGADRTVRFWQPAIGRLVRFSRHRSPSTATAWTPRGEHLLAGGRDGVLRIVDPETALTVAELPSAGGSIHALASSPSGTFALVGGDRGRITKIEIPSSKTDREES